ncbi:IS481 family transposase [Agromyces sp. Soil535]|uniref:IS481 family transposase n=1 Tax=Agromyces sp. Soil535 TaxID=1736390 RepID=UPI0012E34733|nr:IS481 family transposase [Agromyces sp. Soil535]
MTHANARLTVHGRRLIVEHARQSWKQAHIAAAMGVSRRCVKRWIDRYRSEGEGGLRDRSSRPHRCPRRTRPEAEAAVLAVRRVERVGREEIAARTGVPARTVSRILARHGVPHLSRLDPISGQLIRASKTTAVRYERESPGELVHMDVKKLGRIPDGGGWRAHGRASGSIQRDRNTKVGFDYVHSLVDDHTRLAYSEVLPDEKGATCAAFLARAIEYFAAHGIGRIERLMTDNAWAYRWSLRELCTAHGIRQKFIRPHCPWQNGKAERFNRTLQTEWAYRQPFTSNDDRAAALAPWLEHYNTGRRHSALGGQPPISRLRPT